MEVAAFSASGVQHGIHSAMRPLKKKAYFSGKQVSPLNRPAAKLKIGSTAIKSDSGPGEIKI